MAGFGRGIYEFTYDVECRCIRKCSRSEMGDWVKMREHAGIVEVSHGGSFCPEGT